MTALRASTAHIQFGVKMIGWVYLVLGVIGFLPLEALNPYHPEGVGARYMLHFMAIDPLHNAIHLAIGLSGLWAARTSASATWWARGIGCVMVLLFAVGMAQAVLEGLPADQRLLGLVALNSVGHTFHLATGLVALLLGFPPWSGTGATQE